MNEYISREAVNDIIEDMRNNHFILMCERVTLALLKSKVAEILVADVQPVKRGRWENTNTPNQLRCSKCEVIHFIAQYPHGEINFCPNCGARMDLKDGDEE